MDRQLERILADDYLDGLETMPVTDLRALRSECQMVESQLSYLRRLVQGRHDIVSAEIERRRGGGSPDDVADLVERLPEILANRMHAPWSGRPPASVEVGELTGVLVTRLESFADAGSFDEPEGLDDEALSATATGLGVLEADVSALRRRLFDRIDTIQGELTRRYRTGLVGVDELLHDEA